MARHERIVKMLDVYGENSRNVGRSEVCPEVMEEICYCTEQACAARKRQYIEGREG